MKENKNYKGIICLIALLLIVPFTTYKLTVAETVSMWKTNRGMLSEIGRLNNMSLKDSLVSTRIAITADILLNGELISELGRRGALNNLSVDKYIPYVSSEKEGLKINTAEMHLVGSYKNIIKTLRTIELGLTSCRVSSVNIKSIRSPRQKNGIKLQTVLIVQQITE